MSQSFNCPNCGATLEYSGAEHTMLCTYCNTNAAVPEELWRGAEAAEQQAALAKTERRWVTYLLIFLAVVLGVPLCLSLVGAILGIVGSIFGISIPFILSKFFH